jgi:Ca-activated chloride channel family protein
MLVLLSLETAADIAKHGIKVYTIGLGSNGMGSLICSRPNGQLLFQMMKVEIDEQLMKNIARKNRWKVF